MQRERDDLLGCKEELTATIPVEISALLDQYAIVFSEPNALPPHRQYDHKIQLVEGVRGLNLRPYKHSSTQKDVIEEMIQ